MRFNLIFAALALSGCASAPPQMTCDEACAMNNMICVGMTTGESTGTSERNARVGDSLADIINPRSSSHSFRSQSFNCVKDPSKANEIKAYREAYQKRSEENEADWKCAPGRPAENIEVKKYCDAKRASNHQP